MRKLLALNLLGALLLPVLAFAATVTLTADTSVTLPSDNSVYTLSSGGTFDNLSVSGGTMTFTMSGGESVTITAPTQTELANDGGFTYTCAAHSTLTLAPTTSATIVVTPSGTCSTSSTATPGSILPGYDEQNLLPGAISATSSPVASSPIISAPASGLTQSQINAILSLLASFNADSSVIDAVRVSLSGAPSSPSATERAPFTRDLTIGDQGAEVRALQQYLNTHGAPLAESGPGAPGAETTKFGALTRYALAAFQKAVGIMPAAGYFGQLTRAYLNAHS